MGVGGGAGNPISFSEIRDFYGDDPSQPVSLSEYNRGGTLVPQTFAGSQTVTQNTDVTYSNNQATFDDFQVNKSTGSTFSQGGVGSRVVRVSVANGVSFVGAVGSYDVVASDALIFIAGSGIRNEGDDVFSSSGTFNTTGVIVDNSGTQSGAFTNRIYPGPAYQSGDQNNFSGAAFGNYMGGSPCSTGTVTATSDAHNNGGQIIIYSARRTATTTFDVTLKNTSSSTYTITSGSTGTETVYSPNETATILNDALSEGWLVAYDNVTGTGSGTAGDIAVTVANGSGIAASTTVNGGSGTASVTAPSSAFSYVSVTSSASNPDPDGNTNVTGRIFRNGVEVASAFSTEGGVNVSYTGTINANDVFTASGSSGSGVNIITINFKNPDKVITYTNNGSSSLTLGSSSTGGARVLAAGASATVQPSGSTTNQSWAVHFDTSSGNCNTNIPTTISAGNPINMDLFNAPGTPVG